MKHAKQIQWMTLTGILAVVCLAGCTTLGGSRQDPSRGFYHAIRSGDSLAALSQKYGRPVALIAKVNNLDNPARLYVGMPLFIPPQDYGAPCGSLGELIRESGTTLKAGRSKTRYITAPLSKIPFLKKKKAGPRPLDSTLLEPRPMRGNGDGFKGAQKPPSKIVRAKDAKKLGFGWPVSPGKFTIGRYFSLPYASRGLDLEAKRGTAVVASRDGRVIHSSSDLRGFGNLIVIDHGDGYTSIYAHNDRNLVEKGMKVKRGDRIAKVGSTDADCPKLHFEIRKGAGAEPVDPLRYLPSF